LLKLRENRTVIQIITNRLSQVKRLSNEFSEKGKIVWFLPLSLPEFIQTLPGKYRVDLFLLYKIQKYIFSHKHLKKAEKS
jgi:hypothetical protein